MIGSPNLGTQCSLYFWVFCHLWTGSTTLALSCAPDLDLVQKDGKEMEGTRPGQIGAVDAVERE